jgi:hypothetical protein
MKEGILDIASRRTRSLKTLPPISLYVAFSGWSLDCWNAAPRPLKEIQMVKGHHGRWSNERSDGEAILLPEKREFGGTRRQANR